MHFMSLEGQHFSGLRISAICMSDTHAFAGHKNGQLYMFDMDTAQRIWKLNGHTDRIYCIVYCTELDMIISGSYDKTARVWNAQTGECVHVLKGHTDDVTCAAVHGAM